MSPYRTSARPGPRVSNDADAWALSSAVAQLAIAAGILALAGRSCVGWCSALLVSIAAASDALDARRAARARRLRDLDDD